MACSSPMSKPVVAKVHSRIYLMHRYFARRPHNLFSAMISHYSRPGDILLDPFLGGGVTAVEGLSLARKVVGVDLNPMSMLITELQVARVDLSELQLSYNKVISSIKEKLAPLYMAKCENCGESEFAWLEHSEEVACPSCGRSLVLSREKKIGRGAYKCRCGSTFTLENRRSPRTVPVRIKCICGRISDATKYDVKKRDQISAERLKKENLAYPKEKIPLGKKSAEVLNKCYEHYVDLFTPRNLYAFALLFEAIRRLPASGEYPAKKALALALSSCLMEGSKLSHIKNGTVVKAGHHFWAPNVFAEGNVLRLFENRFRKLMNGKRLSERTIGGKYKRANSFAGLRNATCLLLNRSSTELPEIPDNSIDAVITDPPYGGNVNYLELSNFWTVWLKDDFSLPSGIIDPREEATIDSYQHKSVRDYERSIASVLSECRRVLKDRRWLALTFNNRDVKVWEALLSAAHDSGLVLHEKGMLHQPPIKAYMTTLHQRAEGTAFGDYVLSFRKV